tara:strand:- start:109 stop:393 length:285 start_codon:yes stop_codon:yes gene_type:complete
VLVGCITTTNTSDTERSAVVITTTPKPGPTIIRINPNIRMSIRDQIIWFEKLEAMTPKEKIRTFRMLRDGMFKTEKQLEDLGMLYPRSPSRVSI